MKFLNAAAGCLILIYAQLTAQSVNPSRMIKNVNETIEKAGNARIDFTETFVWTMSDHTQTVNGQLWISGDRFKILTDEQDIISDGETIWTVNKINGRVLIDKVDPSDDNLMPRRILFTYSEKYDIRLAGEERVLDRNCYRLVFTAPDRDVLYPEATVWVEKEHWIIRKVEQIDLNGDKLVYTLTDVELGLEIQHDFFVYTPEPGQDVVDLR